MPLAMLAVIPPSQPVKAITITSRLRVTAPGWADNGLFVDVTGKIGRLSNDITIDHYTSDYDTNAVSVTAEAGWRFALNDIFYVEPQAEMMYGHIMSADYRTQTYKADTEAVDMWVGRLGFQTGLTCPEKKGGVYFRASVLHGL